MFYLVKEGAEYYNCNNSNIIKCCKGTKETCGKLLDGTKLQWRYISDLTPEEYIKYDIENKLKELESSNELNETQQDDSFIMSKNN